MPTRYYTAPDGERFPLTEALYDMMFKAYKSDRRKARRSDPRFCILALGIRRHPQVLDVYIGSTDHAYVVFKEQDGEPAHAVHFIIGTKARKVIDSFDKDKKAQSEIIVLKKPAPGQKLEHIRENAAKWRQAVKNGKQVNRRGPKTSSRTTRLGIPHRPRPPISRGGNVDVSNETAA